MHQERKAMKLLTNKEYVTKTNNWYAPLSEFWAKYKSIYAAKLMDKSSSAGDWSGYIVQRMGKKVYAIGFSQENNYPGDGFTFYTMEVPFYVGTVDEKNLIDNIELCYNQI